MHSYQILHMFLVHFIMTTLASIGASSSTPSHTEEIVTEFMAGKRKLHEVMRTLGKSRATVYRYAKMLTRGEGIFDRRTLGNNRKYGKNK